MNTLSFAFAVTAADHLRAASLVARRHKRSWYPRGEVLILAAIAAAFALFADKPLSALWPLWVLLVLLGALMFGVPLLEHREFARQIAAMPERVDLTYEFREDAIHFATRSTTLQLSWNAVHEAIEEKDMFVLHFEGDDVHFLPTSAVGAQVAEFRELLRARLGARAAAVRAGI